MALAPADLIILDRLLPDGDGIELAAELKSGPSPLRPHVLMLTGVTSESARVDGLENGADDYVTKPFAQQELLARVRAGLRNIELQKALLETNRRLELISTSDSITGVRNRRWFDQEIERAFESAIRYERALSLLVIDIDHFKEINDNYGHLAGDEILREMSSRLSSTLRASDSISRTGGEEFAIILPETGLFEAARVAEKLREVVVREPMNCGWEPVSITISVGVASIPHSQLPNPTQLAYYADQAMYRAKSRGRDRIEMERRSEPSRGRRPRHATRENRPEARP